MLLIAGVFFSTLVVLVVRGQRDQARVRRGWQMVLAPWGTEVYHELRDRLEGESRLLDLAYSQAFNARAAGSTDNAVRLLEVGSHLVARTSPDIVALLPRMAETFPLAKGGLSVEAPPASRFPPP